MLNHTFPFMFEALTDALKVKSRMLPSTLKAMVEVRQSISLKLRGERIAPLSRLWEIQKFWHIFRPC